MTEIRVVLGDIATQRVEAVVNAANEALLPGGGVSGAIHRAAGPLLFYACRALGGCEPGEAKITDGYELAARYVIHTVGPVWEGGAADEDAVLTRCYEQCLALAEAHGVRSIAFPSISTGVYEFPVERAAGVAVAAIRGYLDQHRATVLEEVRLVCFDAATYRAYLAAADTPAVR